MSWWESRPGADLVRCLLFSTSAKNPKLVWVKVQSSVHDEPSLGRLAVAMLVHPHFHACIAYGIELEPEVSKLVKASCKDLNALTKLDGTLEASDKLRLHFPAVNTLLVDECIRAWLGDAVAYNIAPGPLLISAERDVVGGRVGRRSLPFGILSWPTWGSEGAHQYAG